MDICEYNSLVLYINLILWEICSSSSIYKTNFAQTIYNMYEFMILLNNVTYFIHSSLAQYVDVQCSAVQCSALHCSEIHYSEFKFISGKCTALHLRALHYVHPSTPKCSWQKILLAQQIFMNSIPNFCTVEEEQCSQIKSIFLKSSAKLCYIHYNIGYSTNQGNGWFWLVQVGF